MPTGLFWGFPGGMGGWGSCWPLTCPAFPFWSPFQDRIMGADSASLPFVPSTQQAVNSFRASFSLLEFPFSPPIASSIQDTCHQSRADGLWVEAASDPWLSLITPNFPQFLPQFTPSFPPFLPQSTPSFPSLLPPFSWTLVYSPTFPQHSPLFSPLISPHFFLISPHLAQIAVHSKSTEVGLKIPTRGGRKLRS